MAFGEDRIKKKKSSVSSSREPNYNFDGIVDYPYNILGSAGAKDYYPHAGYVGIPEPPILIIVGIMIAVFLMFDRTRMKK